MPDTDGVYGVNLARKEQRGQMTREEREAHQRLASLPTYRHEQAPRVSAAMARERSEKSARTKRARGSLTKGSAIWLEGSRPAKGKT